MPLNETSRSLTPKFFGESDKSLGLIKNIALNKNSSIKPFLGLNRESSVEDVTKEISRLRKEGKPKSSIIICTMDCIDVTKIQAEYLYFKSYTGGRVKRSKPFKKRFKK